VISVSNNRMPARLREIIEEFRSCKGHEKLELLLEYAESMHPLPASLGEGRETMKQVHECMTPVFVWAEAQDGRLRFYFDVPPESPTVRGYAALLAEGLEGATPDEVLSVPNDIYLEMGLQEVLSQQRLNGISAILTHLKRLALARLNGSDD
jgi:cysteine desulfuration protein SufE